jgi:hypothetical protein
MISLAFFVEGRHPCGKEIRTEEWLSVCRCFGVDRMLVINRTGRECFYPNQDQVHPAITYATWDELRAAHPDDKYVMIERQGPVEPTMLSEYTHPTDDDVIYCLGPDGGGLEGLVVPGADWVQLPMAANARWGMWAIMAATVVMQDRWLRGLTENS